jgi:hypothetical protein
MYKAPTPAETEMNALDKLNFNENESVDQAIVSGLQSIHSTNADELTESKASPAQAGKTDKGGEIQITNTEFVASVFPNLPVGASVAVSSKPGDPSVGGWLARRADDVIYALGNSTNNFVGCSSFYPGKDGSFGARKANFAAYHFIMLDDLGTKVPIERLGNFELSWLIETSPNNYQGGIVLAEPLPDGDAAVRLLDAVIDAGLCDAGAKGPLSRWARLPLAINGKPKYQDEQGHPFRCRQMAYVRALGKMQMKS